MNAKTHQLSQLATEARTTYAWAQVGGAIARGELVWSVRERIERLAIRYRAHKAAGRHQAAAACKRMAERLADTLPE